MNNYNIKELREKLDRCKSIDLDDVSLDDVDEIMNNNTTDKSVNL